MFESASTNRQRSHDDAERPFWISFSDLMTALMILFLVVMCVAMLSITHKISDTERKVGERDGDIQRLLDLMDTDIKECGDAHLDRERYVIDFGPQAYFDFNSHRLSPAKERYLRSCVPHILSAADSELGRRWIKRIVVEGYTDQIGGYLVNLNLSLQRSQRVLCTLLGKPYSDEPEFSAENRKRIQKLFLVGGYSFNSAKQNADESRRVELRLEFLGLVEKPETPVIDISLGEPMATCPLDPAARPGPVPRPAAPTPTGPTQQQTPPPSQPTAPASPNILQRLFTR